MKKRMILLFMVSILALSMSVSSFAANNTNISVLYKEPEIQVNIPASGGLIINPYQIPVKVEQKVQTSQIVHKPFTVINRSQIKIAVNVAVSAQIANGSKMELLGRSVSQDRSGDKVAFLFLDKRVTDPGVDVTGLDWSTNFNSRNHLLISEESNEREAMISLAPADREGSVGAFHIAGNAARYPDEPWNPSVDKVSIEIIFTFRPKG